MSPRRPTLLALVLGAVATGGCVERRLHITSEPSGARVTLNDRDVGATPVEVDFTWFGVYDVRLTKPGFEPLVTTREAKAPLHETPPFDFFALLVPGTKRTDIDWHFELAPTIDDPDGLLRRAGELRARLDEGDSEEGETGAPPEASASDAVEQPVESQEPVARPATDEPDAPAPPAAPTGEPDYREVTPR